MPEAGNDNQSTKKRGGKGQLRGGDGVQFTSEYQPSNEAKKAGKFRAKTLREIFEAPVSKKTTPEIDELIDKVCKAYGVQRNEISNRLLIELRIAQMAIEQGDEKRYRALMDRLLGKPRNEGWDATPPQQEETPDRQKSQFDLGGGTVFEV